MADVKNLLRVTGGALKGFFFDDDAPKRPDVSEPSPDEAPVEVDAEYRTATGSVPPTPFSRPPGLDFNPFARPSAPVAEDPLSQASGMSQGGAAEPVQLERGDVSKARKMVGQWSAYSTRAALHLFDRLERELAEDIPDERARFKTALKTGAAMKTIVVPDIHVEAESVISGIDKGLATLDGTFQGEMMRLAEERDNKRREYAEANTADEAEIVRLSQLVAERRGLLASLDAEYKRQGERCNLMRQEATSTAQDMVRRMRALVEVIGALSTGKK